MRDINTTLLSRLVPYSKMNLAYYYLESVLTQCVK